LASTAWVIAAEGGANVQNLPGYHSDAEWRRLLTPDQFHMLREHGAERPRTSALAHEKRCGFSSSSVLGSSAISRAAAPFRGGKKVRRSRLAAGLLLVEPLRWR